MILSIRNWQNEVKVLELLDLRYNEKLSFKKIYVTFVLHDFISKWISINQFSDKTHEYNLIRPVELRLKVLQINDRKYFEITRSVKFRNLPDFSTHSF